MEKLTFGTTNKNKLNEASAILGIEVAGVEYPIEEIQSLDIKKVVSEKAKAYFNEIQSPIFVEDTALEFAGLQGLPGTYINDFSKKLGNEGLISLLIGKPMEAKAITAIGFTKDGINVEVFLGEIEGTISTTPLGENGFGWDPIFIPNGHSKTFAQMNAEEKNSLSMRAMALEKFRMFLQL